jgi:predicted nucleotide-binding protein
LITMRALQGDLTGKPTGMGIAVVHSWAAEPNDPIEPLGSRHKWEPMPDAGKLDPDVRSTADRVVAARQLMSGSDLEKQLPVVFIGHGRAKDWLELKEFLKEKLHLGCVEFNSESAAGIPTQERLQDMLKQASFAFLVMTGEDEHADGRAHARENVIHEAGLFQGKLVS